MNYLIIVPAKHTESSKEESSYYQNLEQCAVISHILLSVLIANGEGGTVRW